MKILYISCHLVLEYDEVKLFHELGYDIFSAGAYAYPKYRDGMIRPGIDTLPHYEDLERLASTIDSSGGAIPQELINWADTIIFMHRPEWLEKNWHKMRDKRVIFRSIGQCVPTQERKLKDLKLGGLQIVRYSPKEEGIPDYAGADAMIRFYKDPAEFGDYTGVSPTVFNMSQSLLQRRDFCHYEEIVALLHDFNGKVYGSGNDGLGLMNGGEVSYEEMKHKLRESRAFVYGGTWPASYTLSLIEAMMTGIPVVALGRKLAESDRFEHIPFYEIPDIINNGVSGYVSDDIAYLKNVLGELITNQKKAFLIGQEGRNQAIQLFGKEAIGLQWQNFLG